MDFELAEIFIGGDETKVSGNGESGEVGVHPEFGRGGIAIGKFQPKVASAGRLIDGSHPGIGKPKIEDRNRGVIRHGRGVGGILDVGGGD